jgi:hypothetical protein
VRVVGISDPVELYELKAESVTPEWLEWRDTYENALTLFEAGKWVECCRSIYPLLQEGQSNFDLPCLNLISRALDCLKAPPKVFDPVVDLTSK